MPQRYVGHVPVLPLKKGDLVTIPKGTTILHMLKGIITSKRAYTVIIHDTTNGYEYDGKIHNPKVCWAGSSGYWCYADINDVTWMEKEGC